MKRKQPTKPSQERGPLVGIFWVDTENKEITLIHADPVKSVEQDRGTEFINGPHAHFAVWDLLKAKGALPEKWRPGPAPMRSEPDIAIASGRRQLVSCFLAACVVGDKPAMRAGAG